MGKMRTMGRHLVSKVNLNCQKRGHQDLQFVTFLMQNLLDFSQSVPTGLVYVCSVIATFFSLSL